MTRGVAIHALAAAALVGLLAGCGGDDLGIGRAMHDAKENAANVMVAAHGKRRHLVCSADARAGRTAAACADLLRIAQLPESRLERQSAACAKAPQVKQVTVSGNVRGRPARITLAASCALGRSAEQLLAYIGVGR